MMTPRRFSFAKVGACLLTMVLTGCSGETPTAGSGATASGTSADLKQIILLTNVVDPFWDTCEAGAEAAEKELGLAAKGYKLVFVQNADKDADKGQLDKLKQYNQRSDVAAVGISVATPDNGAVAREMKKLRDKGVKVITFDGDTSREKYRDSRFGYLGTDNDVGGQELGRAAKALAGPDTKYTFFVGFTGSANAVSRMDGFVKGMDGTGEQIERLGDETDKAKARKNVEGALDRNPGLNMLVGIWAYNTPQIVQVVRDRGIREKVKVICFDADVASINAMEKGDVDVMVVQNPYQMGFESVRLLLAMAEGDQATVDEFYPNYSQEGHGDLFRTELRVVVPEGSPITEELFEEDTEFMTIEEFRAWLDERSLKNS